MQHPWLVYLLLVYSCILIGMGIISWFVYKAQPTFLNKNIFFFWCGHFLNMSWNAVVSGAMGEFWLPITMLAWPPVFFVLKNILRDLEPGMKTPPLIMLILVTSLGTSMILMFLKLDFAIVCLPGVLGLGYFGAHMSYHFYLQIRNRSERILELILLCLTVSFVVHMLDYPFLRKVESFAIFGFSYFILNIVGFAAVLPALVVKRLGDQQRFELEEQVRQRSEQLVNQSRLSALGEMAAGVAHEINNPLATIVGRAELILKKLDRTGVDETYIRDSVTTIDRTAFRISKIVRALVDFSRNGDEYPLEVMSVSDLINEVTVLCEEKFHYQNIKLIQEIGSGLKVKSRGPQISQVLLNLLNNSHDAIESVGDKWIRIHAYWREGDVFIEVSDSGPGIIKELQDKVMMPFFTTKEVGKGTGLGLSVSKGMMESHGGRLILDTSRPHTTFVMQLPAVV